MTLLTHCSFDRRPSGGSLSPLPSMYDILNVWRRGACWFGLGTVYNASTRTIWRSRHCFLLASVCGRLSSCRLGETALLSPEDDLSQGLQRIRTLGARLSPDGGTLAVYYTDLALDYLWPIGARRAPRMLHGAPMAVPARRSMRFGPQFSRDGDFYVTHNSTHVMLFESASAACVVSLRVFAAPPEARTSPYQIRGALLQGPLDCYR
mmetsp:Transcript_31236/g.62083  ORF Transcript_31236/g.62083 Transcript_31236/m.62083 type:complete len:207 (-) Transcript_31236:186-806(-)